MPTYQNTSKDKTFKVKDYQGNTCYVSPGFFIMTYQANLPLEMNKVSDEPYFPLAKLNQTVTVSGTGSITDLLEYKVLRLTASATGMAVKAQTASNTFTLPLVANQALDIENLGEISALHFTGTGTVLVVGF